MKLPILIVLVGLLMWTSACQKSDKRTLEEVEKQELAKGFRSDSLFLGLYLGMTIKDFYAVCWDLNKKGVLREASGNMAAAYQLDKGEMTYPVEMNFYPKSIDDKISEMPVRFHYKDWAPWNEHLQSNKLVVEVKNLMEKWYGKGFFISPIQGGGKGIVKVDGNKRIIITVESDSDVFVNISDLTVVK